MRLSGAPISRVVAGLHRAAGTLDDTSCPTVAATAVLLAALKAETPHSTGRLRDSLAVRSEAGGRRFYALAYGAFIVDGTRPHVILPRTKRALFWPGAGHPVRRVHHPGTAPNDFPARAVARSSAALRVLLLAEGRRVIRLIRGDAA